MTPTLENIIAEKRERIKARDERRNLAQALLTALKAKHFNQVNKRMASYLEEQVEGIHVVIARPYTGADYLKLTAWSINSYTNSISVYSANTYESIIMDLTKQAEVEYNEHEKTIKLLEDKSKIQRLEALAKEMADIVSEAGEYDDDDIIKALFDELKIRL